MELLPRIIDMDDTRQESTIHVPTPKTPTYMASRDDRLRAQILYYTAGWSVDDIILQTNLTRYQVQYALENRPIPQKHSCGRHPILDTPHRKYLVAWVIRNSFNRDIPWAELPRWLEWPCSSAAIRTAFKKEHYCRAIYRLEPPLSAVNIAKRLAWAIEHKDWTLDQWDEIL